MQSIATGFAFSHLLEGSFQLVSATGVGHRLPDDPQLVAQIRGETLSTPRIKSLPVAVAESKPIDRAALSMVIIPFPRQDVGQFKMFEHLTEVALPRYPKVRCLFHQSDHTVPTTELASGIRSSHRTRSGMHLGQSPPSASSMADAGNGLPASPN